MTVALVACGEGEETRAVCSLTAELESSLVATDFATDNLSQISPRQLQSTVAVLMGTLAIIDDVSPSSIRAEVEQTIRSYEELSVALQNVYWDGSVAATDDNVQNAIDNLSRNDNVEALEGIRAFIEKQCSVEIASGINEAPGDDQSVTPTSLMIDPQPDINYGFDNEETAVRSYAYFIAAQRGIEISPAQALCLGELMMNSAIDNPAISDEAFESILNASFEKCAIPVK
jgi:hypothetical protein